MPTSGQQDYLMVPLELAARHRRVMKLKLILAAALTVASLTAGPIGYAVRSNGNDHLLSIDLATGVATDLGLVGLTDAEGLSFVGSSLYAIGGTVNQFWNITTPPGALVGATGARSGTDAGLGYDSTTGTLYNIQREANGSSLYTI